MGTTDKRDKKGFQQMPYNLSVRLSVSASVPVSESVSYLRLCVRLHLQVCLSPNLSVCICRSVVLPVCMFITRHHIS